MLLCHGFSLSFILLKDTCPLLKMAMRTISFTNSLVSALHYYRQEKLEVGGGFVGLSCQSLDTSLLTLWLLPVYLFLLQARTVQK